MPGIAMESKHTYKEILFFNTWFNKHSDMDIVLNVAVCA